MEREMNNEAKSAQEQSAEKTAAEIATNFAAENALESALASSGRVTPVRQPTLVASGIVAPIDHHFRDSEAKLNEDGRKTQDLIRKLEDEQQREVAQVGELLERINIRQQQLGELRAHEVRLLISKAANGKGVSQKLFPKAAGAH